MTELREWIKTFWPFLASLVTVTLWLGNVSATAHEALTKASWLDGPPAVAERLARIEQNQLNSKERQEEVLQSLQRIEVRLNQQEQATAARRARLQGL